jgi:hypothetical protein
MLLRATRPLAAAPSRAAHHRARHSGRAVGARLWRELTLELAGAAAPCDVLARPQAAGSDGAPSRRSPPEFLPLRGAAAAAPDERRGERQHVLRGAARPLGRGGRGRARRSPEEVATRSCVPCAAGAVCRVPPPQEGRRWQGRRAELRAPWAHPRMRNEWRSARRDLEKSGDEIRMMVGPASNISNPPRRQLIRPTHARTPDVRTRAFPLLNFDHNI